METIYYSYVTNDDNKLVGVVSLKNLVITPDDTNLEDILENNIIKIEANKDQEEAANLMKKYDLLALPVVGVNDKIIGIVTFDDLIDIVDEEATEDIHKMAGMLPTDDGYLESSFKEVFKNRVFWLIVLLVMQTITGMVLKGFSSVLDSVVALSFYIPLLIGTGGNAGTQSATLVIRGMATGDIENKDIWKLLKREMLLALSMGVILSLLTFGRVFFQEGNNALAMVVSLGLLATIIASMLSGTLLPMFFKLLKLDPALMSGPFISTSIDIIGLVIYLQIARMIMHV
jgi:magnesium transporter